MQFLKKEKGIGVMGVIIFLLILSVIGGSIYYYFQKQMPADFAIVVCQNECFINGSKRCDGDGYQICVDYNFDNCLAWSSSYSCNANQKCSGFGICKDTTPDSQDYYQCFNNDVYWYNSLNQKADKKEECGTSAWSTNYQCSGDTIQRQWFNRGCSDISCSSDVLWYDYENCSMATICQNGSCVQKQCIDETPYSQCSANKPKYCENGNLVDRASLCGCPSGYKVYNEECSLLPYTNEIIIFQEKNPGEILLPSTDELWYVIKDKFIEQFYQVYGDYYDFIALFPVKKLRFHSSANVNINISGIGLNYEMTNLYTERLKSLTVLDFYAIWEFLDNPPLDEMLLKRVLLHEIGHHWLVNDVDGITENYSAHWSYNVDLFNGDPRYLDIMGYYHWIIESDEEICIDGNSKTTIPRFSPLSLYLMGLIPPEEVPPLFVHEYEKKPDDPLFNIRGPNCTQEHKFTKTKTITIQDIIEVNGKRVPSYGESQKDFRIAFVILIDKDTNVPSGFIDYINEYKEALHGAWNQVTVGKSSIK